MKNLIAALAVTFSLNAFAADFKAAYVDLQRAVQEVDEGRAAKSRLQALMETKQKSLEKDQTALKAEKEAFEKQAPAMADAVRSQKEQELQKKLYDFAQRADKMRGELSEQERKELGAIFPKMQALLGQIAAREGLTMVFDQSSSGLAWAPPALDLTNELIRMYNNTYKAGAGGAAAPAPKADAPKADAPKK
jgi:outer membrane protein